jgi:crotonobetainyl-CoA:carnitine CoA-transferase CaiB-like acyl-CoA transferase
MSGPCDGINVVDLTRSLAGALTTMLLADYGAEVTLIEPPEGHPMRSEDGFLVWARGKRSIRLDGGSNLMQVCLDACANADVILEDFEPDSIQFDWAALRELNPRLIRCSVPAFGTDGREAALPPNDALVAARAGILGSQTGFRAGPVFVRPAIASYGTALLAVQAIAAALLARARYGQAAQIAVPILHGALAMQASQLLDIERRTSFPAPRRTAAGALPLYRLYECQDHRWLHLGVLTPRFWPGLALAAGHPEWLAERRYKTMPNLATQAERDDFTALMAAIIAQKPRDGWLRLFQEHDVPCAPALTVDQFRRDDQVVATRIMTELDGSPVGKTQQPGLALDFSRTPGAIRAPAPTLMAAERVIASDHERRPVPRDGSPSNHAPLPLSGIRILDLSSYIAGPLGPAFLADLGADVIKVESPDGDGLRVHAGFLAWNRGKRGLGLDLKRPAAREVLDRLLAGADVLVQNMRPGVAERLGIDYERLRQKYPRLVCCSVTAFGPTGPYRDMPGFDPLLQALSGIERTQGGDQNPPVFLLVPITDNTCAMLNAVGIALALLERERSGKGQLVETSLLRAASFLQADGLLHYAHRPPSATNDAMQLGPVPLYRLYACSDGWIFLDARSRQHRATLADLLQLDPDLLEDSGSAAGKTLATELERRFAERSAAEWLQALASVGVPATAAVEDYGRDFADDRLLTDADLIREYQHPLYGHIRQPVALVRFGEIPASATRPAPLLGEHSREILAEAGYNAESIEALLASGDVVESR